MSDKIVITGDNKRISTAVSSINNAFGESNQKFIKSIEKTNESLRALTKSHFKVILDVQHNAKSAMARLTKQMQDFAYEHSEEVWKNEFCLQLQL